MCSAFLSGEYPEFPCILTYKTKISEPPFIRLSAAQLGGNVRLTSFLEVQKKRTRTIVKATAVPILSETRIRLKGYVEKWL